MYLSCASCVPVRAKNRVTCSKSNSGQCIAARLKGTISSVGLLCCRNVQNFCKRYDSCTTGKFIILCFFIYYLVRSLTRRCSLQMIPFIRPVHIQNCRLGGVMRCWRSRSRTEILHSTSACERKAYCKQDETWVERRKRKRKKEKKRTTTSTTTPQFYTHMLTVYAMQCIKLAEWARLIHLSAHSRPVLTAASHPTVKLDFILWHLMCCVQVNYYVENV